MRFGMGLNRWRRALKWRDCDHSTFARQKKLICQSDGKINFPLSFSLYLGAESERNSRNGNQRLCAKIGVKSIPRSSLPPHFCGGIKKGKSWMAEAGSDWHRVCVCVYVYKVDVLGKANFIIIQQPFSFSPKRAYSTAREFTDERVPG